jgi:hypothetical protein
MSGPGASFDARRIRQKLHRRRVRLSQIYNGGARNERRGRV